MALRLKGRWIRQIYERDFGAANDDDRQVAAAMLDRRAKGAQWPPAQRTAGPGRAVSRVPAIGKWLGLPARLLPRLRSERQDLELEQSDHRARRRKNAYSPGDALDLGLGAGPVSLVAMEHDRPQRGGPDFCLPSSAALVIHTRLRLEAT
jgi:hypothetical protein